MGGEGVGTVIHILAHITGKLVCIVPVTPDTVFFVFFFLFLNQTVGATQIEMKGADTQQRPFTGYRNHMCLFDRQ